MHADGAKPSTFEAIRGYPQGLCTVGAKWQQSSLVYSRLTVPEAALALARHQAGVITREQLIAMGSSRRCVVRWTQEWSRLARGVYFIGPPLGDIPWLAKVWTGILLGGAQARAGLLTAALLEQLVVPGEVVRGFDPPESPITIYVGGRVEPRYGYRFQREEPGLRLPSPAREPARTRIEDTVLDLCAAGDEESTVMWVTRACQRRLTTPRRLADRLTERPRLTGRGLIREMVMDARAGATSNLEHRALHQVFRAHGLPPAQWQHRTGPHQRVADVAFAQYGVLIELDGRVGHVEEGAFRDMRRDNHHTLDGWVTLRFGWADIAANPCAVAAQIARLLRARGWRGDLTPCPFCH